jgi:hypothetical protein
MPLQTRNIKKGKQKSKKVAQKHVTKKRRGSDQGTAAEMMTRLPTKTRSPQRKSPDRGRVQSGDVFHKIQIMNRMMVTMAFLRKKWRKLMLEVMIHLKSNEFVFFSNVLKEIFTIRRMASSTIINGGLISRKIW